MATPPGDGYPDGSGKSGAETEALERHLRAEFEQLRILNVSSVEDFDDSGVVVGYKSLDLDLLNPVVPNDNPVYQAQRSSMVEGIFTGYDYRIMAGEATIEGRKALHLYKRTADGRQLYAELWFKTQPDGKERVSAIELVSNETAQQRREAYTSKSKSPKKAPAPKVEASSDVSQMFSKTLLRAAGLSVAEAKMLKTVYSGGKGYPKGESLRDQVRRRQLRSRVVRNMFRDAFDIPVEDALVAMEVQKRYEDAVNQLGTAQEGDNEQNKAEYRIARERIERLSLIGNKMRRIRLLNLVGVGRGEGASTEQIIGSNRETEVGNVSAQLIHEHQIVRSGNWRRQKRSSKKA